MERSDAELVLAMRAQQAGAFDELFVRWFDRVLDVASNVLRDRERGAEVAQDVFLTVWQQLDRLEDPERFGGWVLRIARNRALNRLDRDRRSTPTPDETMTRALDAGANDPVGSTRAPVEPEPVAAANDARELIWVAMAALGPRDASLADLVVRHGLSPAEVADEVGVSPNNAHQLLFRLRKKLGDAVSHALVWRNGNPRCTELAGLVDSRPTATFDASTNDLVKRHVKSCAECRDQRDAVVAPVALFGAVPVLVAPIALRTEVAAALESAGVPIDATGIAGAEPHPSSADEAGSAQGDGASGTGESSAGSDGDAGADGSSVADRRRDMRDTIPGPGPGPSPSAGAGIGGAATPVPTMAGDHAPDESSGRRRGAVLAVAVLLLFVGAGATWLLLDGDDDDLAITTADPALPADSAEPTALPVAPPVEPSATPQATATAEPTPIPTLSGLALPTVVPTPEPTVVPPTPRPPPTQVAVPPPTPEPTSRPTRPRPTRPTPASTPAPAATPTPPPAPPVIVRFSVAGAVGDGIACATPAQQRRRVVWLTEAATGVSLASTFDSLTGAASGEAVMCLIAGDVVTLTATGPGGQVTGQASA